MTLYNTQVKAWNLIAGKFIPVRGFSRPYSLEQLELSAATFDEVNKGHRTFLLLAPGRATCYVCLEAPDKKLESSSLLFWPKPGNGRLVSITENFITIGPDDEGPEAA